MPDLIKGYNLEAKLIMLDRDGVINYDSVNYIRRPEEWNPIPGSLEAIAKLKQAGFRVAVATNQSGVHRGYYSEETLAAIHQKMQQALENFDVQIDAIFYCPHQPSEKCACRKPKPGLLQKIGEYFQCSITQVPFIGDNLSDVEAAVAASAKPILITASPALRSNAYSCFENLSQAVEAILYSSEKRVYNPKDVS